MAAEDQNLEVQFSLPLLSKDQTVIVKRALEALPVYGTVSDETLQNIATNILSGIGGLPTAGNNPSLVLGYDGSDNLTTVTQTIGGVQYRQTLTYTGGILTGVSAWAVV